MTVISSISIHAEALGWLIRAAARHRTAGLSSLLAQLRAPCPEHAEPRPLHVPTVAKAIARWSRRVPWRSDCVIQALAAKMWLDSRGQPTRLRLAASGKDGELEAHVWLLTTDGEVVTGGRLDVPMAPFRTPDACAAP